MSRLVLSRVQQDKNLKGLCFEKATSCGIKQDRVVGREMLYGCIGEKSTPLGTTVWQEMTAEKSKVENDSKLVVREVLDLGLVRDGLLFCVREKGWEKRRNFADVAHPRNLCSRVLNLRVKVKGMALESFIGCSKEGLYVLEPLPPSSSQPPQPSTSQPSPSLPAKNALGDVKDQAEDEANRNPWYTVDEKSSKMSTEDLLELLWEYPLPEGWYACLPGLQESANYGTKYETGIYEKQVKSGYRLPLHPFALRFIEHYYMALGQFVPNGWRKLVGLIYLVQTSRYKPDATDFMRVFFESVSLKESPTAQDGTTFTKWLAEVEKHLQKAKGKRKEKQPSAELPPALKKTRVIPPDHSPQIIEKVSVEEDPIFRPRWTLRCDDVGMPDSQISEQYLVHGVLPRDSEVFQNQTHETFACSFAQAVYMIYASGSEMLSRFEMARQVVAEEAQQKREAIKEAEEATRRTEELKEVKKARDQGICDFLDGNAGDEWLKKRADDSLKIYELGFAKAKEMFAEPFPDIPLDDFVLPAVISPS
ncbi:hypothetical protein RJ639_025301 [Escallonia herrerae]|uniref:Transposase (putative) gypsy type domain-containing protein n=1 Tax=Escallonia herrerae TaxID=1293975 RepID=A0AA88UVD9_9ASTE|nr:hypothetical protein RJ639_025301 [Escallonia herrerae]